MDVEVNDAAAEIRTQYVARPVPAPATHRDVTDYSYGPPGQSSALANRVNALKHDARARRAEDIDTTLDEITRVFEFTVDEFDHIEWMLRHNIVDR